MIADRKAESRRTLPLFSDFSKFLLVVLFTLIVGHGDLSGSCRTVSAVIGTFYREGV